MADFRQLAPGQTARIHVHDAVSGEDLIVYESPDVLFEAPNWSIDGTALLLNGEGRLWTLAPEIGAEPVVVEHEQLPPINNDHVLDPRGGVIFLSASDRQIYRAQLAGGAVEQVTEDVGHWHFLHGVSPDGSRLAYVRISSFDQPGVLALISAEGGVSTVVDTGDGHVDGPEWSPDGHWLYFNTENWASEPGHAQLARVPDGGGDVERLVASDSVDWFPHLSPDGARAVYIEFPLGTRGHPADLEVNIVVVDTAAWSTPKERIALSGGQGTINVNSWAPDSRRFAYVSYPVRP